MIPDEELMRILLDDCPFGDITTQGLGIDRVPASALLAARDEMTLAGVEEAARMFELCGVEARIVNASGTRVVAGTPILAVTGTGGALHRSYKMAQTLLEILGGIATAARAIVQAAQAQRPQCRVVCTRKHMPGIKRWAVKAIEAGGASPHRLGLSDSILVFDEHWALIEPGGSEADCIARLRASAPERKVAAEASTVERAIVLAQAGADIVQVDKLAPEALAGLAREFATMAPRPLLAAAGGINAGNAVRYAASGADLLVTSAPYHAPPRDVKVTISRMTG